MWNLIKYWERFLISSETIKMFKKFEISYAAFRVLNEFVERAAS